MEATLEGAQGGGGGGQKVVNIRGDLDAGDDPSESDGVLVGAGIGAAFLVLCVMYCIYRRNKKEGKADPNQQWIEWNDGSDGEDSYRRSLRGADERLKSQSLWPGQLQMSAFALGHNSASNRLSMQPESDSSWDLRGGAIGTRAAQASMNATPAAAPSGPPVAIERRTISNLNMNDLYNKMMKDPEPVPEEGQEPAAAPSSEGAPVGDKSEGDDAIPARSTTPASRKGSVFAFLNPFMSRSSVAKMQDPEQPAMGATSRNPILAGAGTNVAGPNLLSRTTRAISDRSSGLDRSTGRGL